MESKQYTTEWKLCQWRNQEGSLTLPRTEWKNETQHAQIYGTQWSIHKYKVYSTKCLHQKTCGDWTLIT